MSDNRLPRKPLRSNSRSAMMHSLTAAVAAELSNSLEAGSEADALLEAVTVASDIDAAALAEGLTNEEELSGLISGSGSGVGLNALGLGGAALGFPSPDGKSVAQQLAENQQNNPDEGASSGAGDNSPFEPAIEQAQAQVRAQQLAVEKNATEARGTIEPAPQQPVPGAQGTPSADAPAAVVSGSAEPVSAASPSIVPPEDDLLSAEAGSTAITANALPEQSAIPVSTV